MTPADGLFCLYRKSESRMKGVFIKISLDFWRIATESSFVLALYA